MTEKDLEIQQYRQLLRKANETMTKIAKRDHCFFCAYRRRQGSAFDEYIKYDGRCEKCKAACECATCHDGSNFLWEELKGFGI